MQTNALRAAAQALYDAGRWELPSMPPAEQAKLWEALRDALGLAPGHATSLCVDAALTELAGLGQEFDAADNIVDFDARKVTPYLWGSITSFMVDPPDSDYQRGYLAAIINVLREGIGRDANDARLVAAEKLLGGN